MSINSNAELMQEFLSQAAKLVEAFDTGVMDLEKKKDAQLIDELLRILHTLKGDSANLQSRDLETCAHDLEEILIAEKNKSSELAPEVIRTLFEGSDTLQRLLKEYENPLSPHAPLHRGARIQKFRIAVSFHDSVEDPELEALQIVAILRSVGTIIETKPELKALEAVKEFGVLFESSLDRDELDGRLSFDDAPYELSIAPDEDHREQRQISQALQELSSVASIDNIILQTTSIDSKLHVHMTQLADCIQLLQRDHDDLFEKIHAMRISVENDTSLEKVYSTMLNTLRASYQQQRNALIKHQYSLMDMMSFVQRLMIALVEARMIPMHQVFSGFRRIVRDTALQLGKKVALEYSGGETSVDREISEKIIGVLTHCVRNAIDHGVESPHERKEKGKSEEGKILIHAESDGESITIRVSDDGGGIDTREIKKRAIAKGLLREGAHCDEELYELLFSPGFSTKDAPDKISGRGIGMDSVRSDIQALRGGIRIDSQKERGTTVTIHFPVTLALINGFLTASQENYYVFPVKNIRKSYRSADVFNTSGYSPTVQIDSEYVPYSTVEELLGGNPAEDAIRPYVLHADFDGYSGLIGVDAILGNESFSVKSMYGLNIYGIGGTCVTGTSNIALLVSL